MKKLILTMLVGAMLVGCGGIKDGVYIISSKYYTPYYNERLPSGICRYYYTIDGTPHPFQDSCNKYNLGDTIK